MRHAQPGDWNTEPLPAAVAIIPLDRRFTPEEMRRIEAGLVPEEMEDKWFIYWHDDHLYFHRSWTGFCVYVIRFERDGRSARMVEARVNRDSEQYSETSDSRDAALIDYLIDVLLLRQHAEFPAGPFDADEAALAEWSEVGRAMLGDGLGGR